MSAKPPPASLAIATTNPHKASEIREILEGVSWPLLTLAEVSAVPEPRESGATFEENARLKASHYALHLQRIVVAEDSGLEVAALDGLPGVRSARFNGERYEEKFEELFRLLQKRGVNPPCSARFVCAVAVAAPRRIVVEFRGEVEGELVRPARGANGFGYDPIFYYPPFARTFGELSREEKRAVSHRGQAFRDVRAWLIEQERTDPPVNC